MGANVIGYALDPPSIPNMFEGIGLKFCMTHVYGDVRDYNNLSAVFKDYGPEIVFHLAAQSLVRKSYRDPRTTYETNVMGTVNLLEAVRLTKSVKVVINVTSDKCYDNKEWVWGYRENDPMGGHDPYSSSKGCSELVTAAYLKSYFSPERFRLDHNVALSSVRAGNVLGGGDWGLDRLVPDCIRALANGEVIQIRNPNSIRPWQHVMEPLRGYIMLAERLWINGAGFSGPWNFGPSVHECWKVETLVNRLIKLWGDGKYSCESSDQLHEARTLNLYSTKAATLLGWKAIMNMNEALSQTIDWYKTFYSGVSQQDLAVFTTDQLRNYFQRTQ